MNRFAFIFVSCVLFSQCLFGMKLVRFKCQRVSRRICSESPLNLSPVKELLETQKNISEDDYEDTRDHLHSLCNGYYNYLNARNVDEFKNVTPSAVQKDINKSIILAHRTIQIRGALYGLLTSFTSAAAITLALKSGDIQLLQEPLANQGLVLASLCSLAHSTNHTAAKAHQYLIKTGATIEANIAWNTALLREHLGDTAKDL